MRFAWAGVLLLAGSAGVYGASRPAYEPPEEKNERILALVERYREQIELYARGDAERALASTATFESHTLTTSRKHGLEQLDRAERHLFDEFTVHGRPVLLPLAAFHRDLMLQHFAAHRWGLAQRAEMEIERLLAAFGGGAESVERRRLAASAFASFAADLIAVPAPHRAQEMLVRALLLAPDHTGASLTLGVLLQQDYRLPLAALRFDRALGFAPDDRETQLRRALLRATLEGPERAAEALERLGAPPADDWIAVVAVQEQARARLAAGDHAGAAETLAMAAPRFPSEPSLSVALAFAERRAGRRSAADAALESALTPAPSTVVSARRRFAEVPIARLAEDREAFAAAVSAGLGDLAKRILTAPAAEGAP